MLGKIIDGVLFNAPQSITVEGMVYYNPTDEIYFSQGYKEIIDTPYPETEDNKYYTYSYEERDDKIIKVWTEAEPTDETDVRPTIEDRMADIEAKLEMTMEALDYMLLNEVNVNG